MNESNEDFGNNFFTNFFTDIFDDIFWSFDFTDDTLRNFFGGDTLWKFLHFFNLNIQRTYSTIQTIDSFLKIIYHLWLITQQFHQILHWGAAAAIAIAAIAAAAVVAVVAVGIWLRHIADGHLQFFFKVLSSRVILDKNITFI